MKELNNNEREMVSGGDIEMVITGRVASNMSYWMTALFSEIVTGQISDTASFQQFINYAQTNGAVWDEVRLLNISYGNFN